jgi:DNA-binding transcriptional ArsR family regulator
MNKERSVSEKLSTVQALESFAAMAQETRLSALRLLLQAGGQGICAGDLSRTLAVAHNTLSFHLSQLLAADLIQVEKQGRNMIYRANFSQLNALIAFLTDECCQGMACELTPALATADLEKNQ